MIDAPISLLHHLEPCADYSIAINTTNLTERQTILCDCESKIRISKGFSSTTKKPKMWTFEFFEGFFAKKPKNHRFFRTHFYSS